MRAVVCVVTTQASALPELEALHDKIRNPAGCGLEPCEGATNIVPGKGARMPRRSWARRPGATRTSRGPFVGHATCWPSRQSVPWPSRSRRSRLNPPRAQGDRRRSRGTARRSVGLSQPPTMSTNTVGDIFRAWAARVCSRTTYASGRYRAVTGPRLTWHPQCKSRSRAPSGPPGSAQSSGCGWHPSGQCTELTG